MRSVIYAIVALGLAGASATAHAGESGWRVEMIHGGNARNETREVAYLVQRTPIRLGEARRGRFDSLGFGFLKSLRLETKRHPVPADRALDQIALAERFDDIVPQAGNDVTRGSSEINLVRDIDTGGPLQPFVLGGIATRRLSRSNDLLLESVPITETLGFDFQLGAGMAYRLDERVNVTAGYRYVGSLGRIAGFEESRIARDRPRDSSHVFGLSVRIPFGPLN